MRLHHCVRVTAIYIVSRRNFLLIILLNVNNLLPGQPIIALQNFESTGSNFNYTAKFGTLQSGYSSASDRLAAVSFFVSNNTALRVTNKTDTIEFENINSLQTFADKKLTMRIAAFSINSSGNGLDFADKITLGVSLDGGNSYSNEIILKGFSNAYWHYTTGLATAYTSYDGNNIATEFAPSSGGNRTTDGYSKITLQLPDSSSQCKLRIIIQNDSNNEAWLMDDVKLLGCPSTFLCPGDTTLCLDSGLFLLNADPPDGMFAGPGVSNNYFDPLIAGLGLHLISYNYSDTSGCAGSCQFNIAVNGSAIQNIQSGNYYCSMYDALNVINENDELIIPEGNYIGSNLPITNNLKFTTAGIVTIDSLEMNGSGKYLMLGGDLKINQLKLNSGKVRTNGNRLSCLEITGGNSASYIITD